MIDVTINDEPVDGVTITPPWINRIANSASDLPGFRPVLVARSSENQRT